jgi:hypothetical protein
MAISIPLKRHREHAVPLGTAVGRMSHDDDLGFSRERETADACSGGEGEGK